MTALLQEVFQKISLLPDDIQDMFANHLLQEMEWEKQWDSTLENSQSVLDKLTLKAMHEYKAGRTTEKGFVLDRFTP